MAQIDQAAIDAYAAATAALVEAQKAEHEARLALKAAYEASEQAQIAKTDAARALLNSVAAESAE